MSIICRKVKNAAYNFSDAQVKVREATSCEHQDPSTALMSEIADLTHNPKAFTEIMSIIWKRLNDSGKNWRRVRRSLVLLEFLIVSGHEKVIVYLIFSFWIIGIICRWPSSAVKTSPPLKHLRTSNMWRKILRIDCPDGPVKECLSVRRLRKLLR
ncbi:unnamed protein product [Caenorhabditis brenneri]